MAEQPTGQKTSNPPAFPATEAHGLNSPEWGMGLLDYFAAKAMQALMSGDVWVDGDGVWRTRHSNRPVPVVAFEIARDMMTARLKLGVTP